SSSRYSHDCGKLHPLPSAGERFRLFGRPADERHAAAGYSRNGILRRRVAASRRAQVSFQIRRFRALLRAQTLRHRPRNGETACQSTALSRLRYLGLKSVLAGLGSRLVRTFGAADTARSAATEPYAARIPSLAGATRRL